MHLKSTIFENCIKKVLFLKLTLKGYYFKIALKGYYFLKENDIKISTNLEWRLLKKYFEKITLKGHYFFKNYIKKVLFLKHSFLGATLETDISCSRVHILYSFPNTNGKSIF